MTAITTILSTVPVSIEYDLRDGRATKEFDDASAAKKFFVAKEKAGKNPKVVGAPEPEPVVETKEPEAKPEPKEKTKTEKKGLKVSKGRPYFAAQVLAEVGLAVVAEKGVTDEMVSKVDTLSGKPNPTESLAWLRIAFNLLSGAAEAAKS